MEGVESFIQCVVLNFVGFGIILGVDMMTSEWRQKRNHKKYKTKLGLDDANR